jgi:hypothetical protein
MRYCKYWLAHSCKSISMSTPVTKHRKELGRNKVKPHVPFCGLVCGAVRHAETTQSRMVGRVMKENLGEKKRGGWKWSNWDSEWEFEDNAKNLKIVSTPAARWVPPEYNVYGFTAMVAYSVGYAKVTACLHYGLISVCSKWELRS